MPTEDIQKFLKKYESRATGDDQSHATARLKKKHFWTLIFILGFIVYLLVCIAAAWLLEANRTVIIFSAIAFTFAAFGSFLINYFLFQSRQRESERKLLKQIYESTPGARLITNAEDKTIFYNGKFIELFEECGKPEINPKKEGLAALTSMFIANKETEAHFRLLADQAHRGLVNKVELQGNCDARDCWLSVLIQPLPDLPGHVHWMVEDISEQRMIDRAIREEREKLIDFTDNAPVGFFSVNEDGRFVFVNGTFARWVGEDIHSLLNNRFLHTYLETPPENTKPYNLKPDGGARQIVELMMKGPGGRSFLASINQTVVRDSDGRVRTRAVVNDLTSERAMRQALKASEDRFQRFFDEAPVGIALIGSDGNIDDCNEALTQFLDRRESELINKPLEDIVAEQDRAASRMALEQVGRGRKGSIAPIEVRLIAKDHIVTVNLYARKFKDSDKTVLHFIDVTQRKTLEEQFVQSQKMQAIGQLAGGIAHDFNNLLTAMIGFCDLLLIRHKPGDPSFSDIMQIKQNANRAANLVRQLLAFSRQQTLRPKVQDVTDILTELSHLMRRLLGTNIEMDVYHGQNLGFIKVDEGQMEQVLINLAVNARDAMEGGGRLRIATSVYTNSEPVKLLEDEMPPGKWVAIEVRDTGCGIPPDILKRIFEPFFTTKDVGQGTGLGLATVYGIIRQTGGYLHVETKVNEGTAFIIYLPRLSESEAEQETDTHEIEDDRAQDLTGTARILLVEDEDAVRMFSTRALTNKGYEVLAADCGEAAVNLVKEQAANAVIDLVITDVMMPGMDGPTLVKKLRDKNPDLKVIFISGYTEDKLKDHMDDNISFLPKPFTLKQLAGAVKEMLD